MKRFLLAIVITAWLCGSAGAAVNVNTATKEELTAIKGLGANTAQEIIDYRTQNGPFKSVDDLEKVPGVSSGLLKRIRSQITIGGSSATDKPAQKTIKSKTITLRMPPAKTEGLKSDKASGKIAEKLTTRSKAQKKSK